MKIVLNTTNALIMIAVSLNQGCSAFVARSVAPLSQLHRTLRRCSDQPTVERIDRPSVTDVPLLLSEGMFAVNKPVNWTSSNVVSFIRKTLERDARERGANPAKIGSKRMIKVGHGGTLDPLATGVLVIAVGKATKELKG
jgi:hypothetical protein